MRFTLAHELGHVLIPWHTGSIVDETDIGNGDENADYWQLEGEANRFASELLMPTKWVLEIAQQFASPLDVTEKIANVANVSFHAATIKLIGCLPQGFIFAQTQEGIVRSSGRSPGTLANQPFIGEAVNPEKAYPWAKSVWHKHAGDLEYHWWRSKADKSEPAAIDARGWRNILDSILVHTGIHGEELKKFKQSINGIIAYANGHVRVNRSSAAIYDACLQRLHSVAKRDARINAMLEHDEFDAFLWSKISDLIKLD